MWIVIKIGNDPKYWVQGYGIRGEAMQFINDQLETFPGKFKFILCEKVAEFERRSVPIKK